MPSLYFGFKYTMALILFPNRITYILCHTNLCEMFLLQYKIVLQHSLGQAQRVKSIVCYKYAVCFRFL